MRSRRPVGPGLLGGPVRGASGRDTHLAKANGQIFTEDRRPRKAKLRPSQVIPGRVFFCIFDDLEGLRNCYKIGFEQLLFETDYPHTDSTWPDSLKVAEEVRRGWAD